LKTHIDYIRSHCLILKNLFSIIANTKLGPSIKTLVLLFKSLVRSKVDYGLLAYGNASKTNIEKLNIVCRAIIRTILGSKQSTPTQILYAETGTEPIADRRSWLTGKYIIKLGHKHQNPTYKSAQAIFSAPVNYPPRSYPCLAAQMAELQKLDIDVFPTFPQWPPIYRFPPPPQTYPLLAKLSGFPSPKKKLWQTKPKRELSSTLSYYSNPFLP
jgi:hypothetical protein